MEKIVITIKDKYCVDYFLGNPAIINLIKKIPKEFEIVIDDKNNFCAGIDFSQYANVCCSDIKPKFYIELDARDYLITPQQIHTCVKRKQKRTPQILVVSNETYFEALRVAKQKKFVVEAKYLKKPTPSKTSDYIREIKEDGIVLKQLEATDMMVSDEGDFILNLELRGKNLKQIENIRFYINILSDTTYFTVDKKNFLTMDDRYIHLKFIVERKYLLKNEYLGTPHKLRFKVNVNFSSETEIYEAQGVIGKESEKTIDEYISVIGVSQDCILHYKVSKI